MSLAWKLALRFRQKRYQSGYLSFMSTTSMVGIALGCFVLIMLLSVMNGFERELTQRLLSVIPHAELYSVNKQGIADWRALQNTIEEDERVADVMPFTQITGLIQKKNSLKAVSITGVNPSDLASAFSSAISPLVLSTLQEKPRGVVLGKGIVNQLGYEVGDPVVVLIPQSSDIQQMRAPKRLTLELVGTLSLGGDIDNQLGIMHLDTASQALQVDNGAQGLRIMLRDPFAAPALVREYGYEIAQPVYMSDWTRTHGHILKDIQLVRLVVYIVLTLVISVACFNVVSTLVMAVKAKQSAIAILVSMGATPSLIRRTFLLQGLINGVVGTAVGVVLALLVVPNLTAIVSAVESSLNVQVLSSDVYFVDFLPTQLSGIDVIITVSISLVLSVLASLYPAARAARVKPAEVLS